MTKKTLFIIGIFLMLTASVAYSATITVDNKTPSAGNYTTLQAAHDAAASGDTIYVLPSGVAYSAITVTKKLNITGTGFDYPGPGLNTTKISGTISFNAGSNGSSLQGFGGYFIVFINANNIEIKRNALAKIDTDPNINGIVILQNYVSQNLGGQYLIVIDPNIEVLIANNIVVNKFGQVGGPYGSCIYAVDASVNITILNNIFYATQWEISLGSSNNFIANNIFVNGSISLNNKDKMLNNISKNNDLPSKNGNINSINMSTVFIDFTNGDYRLLPNSPALGGGQNGVDMGIYGGDSPFVDGGAPGIPSIIELNSSHIGSQEGGLDVTIKAKSNKE